MPPHFLPLFPVSTSLVLTLSLPTLFPPTGSRSLFVQPLGDLIRDSIDKAIRIYDKLLLILSQSSVESQWVRFEVEAALEKEHQRGTSVLFPIRLDESVMTTTTSWAAMLRRERHIGDFTMWRDYDHYQKGLQRLIRDLQSQGKPPSP
jgi:hypothetical protein